MYTAKQYMYMYMDHFCLEDLYMYIAVQALETTVCV